MSDLPDLDLRRTSGGTDGPSPDRRSNTPWIAAAVLLVAAAIAAYFVFWGPSPSEPASTGEPDATTVMEPPAPLGVEPVAPIELPPLDATDTLVRELLAALSSHPRIAAWLATDGLIRNFTVVVSNTSEGKTPVTHLSVLKPTGPFRTLERGPDLLVDARSFERYDGVTQAFTSVNAGDAARLYSTLKPRIEDAYRELGFPNATFDRALERAIVLLLGTPIPAEPIAVEPKGIVYGFADDRLEGLTPAQKQLLRFGPKNARAIQRQLRDIALALGVPASRLPPPGL